MNNEAKLGADVYVQGEGTLFLFHPLTDAAKEWIRLHVQSDAQYFGSALVVEHRFAENLVDGMLEAGLVLR